MPLKSLNQTLIDLPRAGKRLLALTLDVALCALTAWFAWYLRLDHFQGFGWPLIWTIAASWLLGLPIFMRFGLYAAVFRFAGWNAMLALGQAVALYGVLYAAIFTVVGVPGVPRTIGIIQPLLMFVALGLSRLGVRLWLGDLYRQLVRNLKAPGVLIYGAGEAGRQLAASIRQMNGQHLVGFVDDDPALQGRELDSVPVYAPERLASVIPQHTVHDVLLALPSVSRERRKEIIQLLQPHPVHVRTLPGLAALVEHGLSPADLQDLDVEDLLGRDPVAPDRALMGRHLGGKIVLITGAGGSIGSELCRQILRWSPQTLLLLEQSEFALYRIHQELRRLTERGAQATLVPLLGSVQDASRIDEILATWHPNIVFHAAAYKHVPLVERNPLIGLRNNVWGTLVCAQAAARHGVDRFVLISTDKAVRPTNVMGASKRLSEMVLQSLAAANTGPTCYTMVRFGNVLGSSGSVVPLFRRQIAVGGPVTVTHRDITRFFMTIPEAAQLVIQAGAMAQGGEVFVLDMGEPVRIYDLARRMIQLTGRHVRDERTPWGDIEIRVVGLRPGEKLYEELLIGDDTRKTEHPRIFKANERFLPWGVLERSLKELEELMGTRQHVAVRELLMRVVDGYHPAGDIADWDYLERHGRMQTPSADDATPPEQGTPSAGVATSLAGNPK